jgi:hypothetical protein
MRGDEGRAYGGRRGMGGEAGTLLAVFRCRTKGYRMDKEGI